MCTSLNLGKIGIVGSFIEYIGALYYAGNAAKNSDGILIKIFFLYFNSKVANVNRV